MDRLPFSCDLAYHPQWDTPVHPHISRWICCTEMDSLGVQFPCFSSWDSSSSHTGKEKVDTDSWSFSSDLVFGNPGTGIWAPFSQLPGSSAVIALTGFGLALVQCNEKTHHSALPILLRPYVSSGRYFTVVGNLSSKAPCPTLQISCP